MKTLLDKNLECLKDSFNRVYRDIAGFEINSDCKLQATIEQTKNGLPNIKINNGSSNIFLHSNYDPGREIASLLSSKNFKNKDTVVIFGFGMGYHIEALINEFPKMNKLIIEPSRELFYKALSARDLRHIFKAKNVELLLEEDMSYCVNYLSNQYVMGKIFDFELLELPGYVRIFGDKVQEVKVQFTKFLRTYNVNLRTEMFFFDDWIKNFYLNLNQVAKSADIEDLAGKFNGVPAIMVSAGPSLKKNIEVLRQVENRAIIIANGSTVSILQEAGIKPHIMLGIDGCENMSEIFCSIQWTDIIFAYLLNVHHRCVNLYQGPKLYLKSNAEPMVQALEEGIGHPTRIVQTGGSCANVSMDFINILGCDPIIMIGQDLAYTGMEVYAEGHLHKDRADAFVRDSSNLIKVKDIYGNEIFTAQNLLTMLYTFENYVGKQPATRHFINATEGGIPIKGVPNMTLHEAVDTYCSQERDVKAMLDLMITESSTKNLQLGDAIFKFVEDVEREATEITELSEKRIDLVNQILDDLEKSKMNDTGPKNKNLSKLTKKLEGNKLFKSMYNPIIFNIFLHIKNRSENLTHRTVSQREKLIILNQGLRNQYEVVDRINAYTREAARDFLNTGKREV